jgi:hypothetical protein
MKNAFLSTLILELFCQNSRLPLIFYDKPGWLLMFVNLHCSSYLLRLLTYSMTSHIGMFWLSCIKVEYIHSTMYHLAKCSRIQYFVEFSFLDSSVWHVWHVLTDKMCSLCPYTSAYVFTPWLPFESVLELLQCWKTLTVLITPCKAVVLLT